MAERTLSDVIADRPAQSEAPALDLGRVKRNVGKMVSQGAPEDEIDAYIGHEGTTVDAIKAFKPQAPDVGVDMAKGLGYGTNTGFDATLNMIGAPGRYVGNLVSQAVGGPEDYFKPIEVAQRFNVAGPAEGLPGRVVQAVGEVAGSSALPAGALMKGAQLAGPAAAGILGQMASAPGRAAAVEGLSTVGSGLGVSAARENELGPTGELVGGLVGGFAVPNAINMAARTYGGARSGLQYANRQIMRARDPETAAYRDIADVGVKAGMDFDEARRTVTPPGSANLTGRGFTEDDMANIVSRQLNGEHAEDVVRDYAHLVDGQGRSLTPATARAYLQRYQDANPVGLNIVDLGKEQLGTGGAIPLSNQARTDMAIADDPVAAGRLIERQRAQPGRVAEAIEQSGVEGRNLEDELRRLSGVGHEEEEAAYALVRQNAQPVDLRPAIGAGRRTAAGRQGEVGETLDKATDLFFRPTLEQPPQSPATALRLTEMEERIAGARANGASPEVVNRLQRRLDVAREQDLFSRPAAQRGVGEPITDLREFLDARRELDQMITRSMQDGRPTPLTQVLTEFRTRVNAAARRNNAHLTEADRRFSENRTIERIIGRGGDLAKKLTPQSRRALREFDDMTPNQQEIMRVAFEQRMMDDALNVRRGNAAADQFRTDAFNEIVGRLYPAPTGARGPARTAQQVVHDRGQTLLRRLEREAITTETTRDALSGSRTAPLADDMAEMMEGPRAAADALTGRWGKLVENISNRLTRQIGQTAARERVRILTETDPAQLLPMLRRLSREAATAGERQTYDVAIRQFARVRRQPGVDAGVIINSQSQDNALLRRERQQAEPNKLLRR